MLPEELIDMAKQVRMQKCESNRLEIKAAREGCPKRLYDTLSGFSNQDDGGILLFGIDESNDYQICGVYDAADLQRKLESSVCKWSRYCVRSVPQRNGMEKSSSVRKYQDWLWISVLAFIKGRDG